jgi:glycosyltransferase involved in cell wall biosynthesis
LNNKEHKIRIGLDAIALPTHFSGAAHYIINLIRNILTSARSFDVTIFCKTEHSILFLDLLREKDEIQNIDVKNRINMIYFYERGLKRLLIKNKIDLFHAMHYIVPPKDNNYKIFNTVHDMGFLMFPQYYEIYKRIYFKLRMKTFLNRSEKINSVSRQTSDSIINKYPGFANKIFTNYPGIDHLSPKVIDQEKENFILAVNTFEKRKNIPFLIDLFYYMTEKYNLSYDFILVGQKANDFKNINKQIRRTKYSDRIKIKTNVSEKELISLYRKAQFFLNASEFEGFGFTTFEAILQSCPSFVYKKAVPDNIISNKKYIMDNLNLDKWAKSIIKEKQVNFTNQISPSSIRELTWEKSAGRIIEIYNATMNIKEKAIV